MDGRLETLLALCMDFSAPSLELKPLTNAEFYKLLRAIDKYSGVLEIGEQASLFEDNAAFEFADLLHADAFFLVDELKISAALADKVEALLKRSSVVAFELEKLDGFAQVVTIFDDSYPKTLRRNLNNLPGSLREPPILFFCGDIALFNSGLLYAGFAGARNSGEKDLEWTRHAVSRIQAKGKIQGVVSGGAEGIDAASEACALDLGMPVVEFSKSMKRTLRDPIAVDAVQDGQMILASNVNPLRKLSRYENTAYLMGRNRLIYAMSEYTVVVKSALGPKSGTWAGAKEALDRDICPVYVRNAPYEGNIDLINKGGKPIE